jgi:hypothetical protein
LDRKLSLLLTPDAMLYYEPILDELCLECSPTYINIDVHKNTQSTVTLQITPEILDRIVKLWPKYGTQFRRRNDKGYSAENL